MPMDIDFIVQDTYALVRPQWKLVTDLAEAARVFAEACAANYQARAPGAAGEPIEDEAELSSEEEVGEDGIPEMPEEPASSDEEADVSGETFCLNLLLTAHRELRKRMSKRKALDPMKKNRSSSPVKKKKSTLKKLPILIELSKA